MLYFAKSPEANKRFSSLSRQNTSKTHKEEMDIGSFLKKFKESQVKRDSLSSDPKTVETAPVSLSFNAHEHIVDAEGQLSSDNEDDNSLSEEETENGTPKTDEDSIHVYHASSKRISRVAVYYSSQNGNGASKKDFTPLKGALTNLKSGSPRKGEFRSLQEIRQSSEINRCRSLVEAKRSALISRQPIPQRLKRIREEDRNLSSPTVLQNFPSSSQISETSSTSRSYIAFNSESSSIRTLGQVSVDDLLPEQGVEADLESLLAGDKVTSPLSLTSPTPQLNPLADAVNLTHEQAAKVKETVKKCSATGEQVFMFTGNQDGGPSTKEEKVDSVHISEVVHVLPLPVKEKTPPASSSLRSKKMSKFERAKTIAKGIDSLSNSKWENLSVRRL